MAFAETRGNRIVREGVCPVEVTLAENIKAGDCLGITGGTWVLSAHASGEQPILVASVDANSTDIIKGYMMAVVEVVTTATNVATVGEIVSLSDTGEYVADTGNYPDVGFVASIGSDSKTAILFVCPAIPQLSTIRA